MAQPRPAIAPTRIAFCASLRAEREQRELTLARVAEVTRIPIRSLELLEAGAFEALPGEVFVRGFVVAYAKCLHLDTDLILERYNHCKAGAAVPKGRRGTTNAANPVPPPLPAATLMQDSAPRKRLGVTFAVILILIVATLTISYFLRSTDSAGSGITMIRSALG